MLITFRKVWWRQFVVAAGCLAFTGIIGSAQDASQTGIGPVLLPSPGNDFVGTLLEEAPLPPPAPLLSADELPALGGQSAPPLLNGPVPVAPIPAGARPPAPSLPESLGQPPGTGTFPDDQFTPDEAMETLSRGPVHEAFVDVFDSDPQPSPVVPLQPPADVDELAPEQMPEGDNVQWIPGYWAFDDEANDFLWIGGLWRNIPPGQRWVPGYWTEVDGGFQWISGFWTAADSTELAYLPEPPASLEVGPNIPAPSEDYFWIPGSWNYQQTAYRWSPGYWSPVQENWIWVPQRYVYTPRGCLCTRGYWDYRLSRRGILFAPIRFARLFRGQRFLGYRYRPYYGIGMNRFLVNLFTRPARRSYFFGDYYGPRYAGLGYQPWHLRTLAGGRRAYDPVFNYYNWQSRRSGVDFTRQLNQWNQYYVNNADQRPPRTQLAQRDFLTKNINNPQSRDNALLRTIRSGTSDLKFDTQLRQTDRLVQQQHAAAVKLIRGVEQDRREIERRVASINRQHDGLNIGGLRGGGLPGITGETLDSRGDSNGRGIPDGRDGRIGLDGKGGDGVRGTISDLRNGLDIRGDRDGRTNQGSNGDTPRLKLAGIPEVLKERARTVTNANGNTGRSIGTIPGLDRRDGRSDPRNAGSDSRVSPSGLPGTAGNGREREIGRLFEGRPAEKLPSIGSGNDGRNIDPRSIRDRILGGNDSNGGGLPRNGASGNDRSGDSIRHGHTGVLPGPPTQKLPSDRQIQRSSGTPTPVERRVEERRSDIGAAINGRSDIGRPNIGVVQPRRVETPRVDTRPASVPRIENRSTPTPRIESRPAPTPRVESRPTPTPRPAVVERRSTGSSSPGVSRQSPPPSQGSGRSGGGGSPRSSGGGGGKRGR
ncbi:MAG: hypothetical protein R3C01_03780 [Planctomycetaceae bacterium]